MPIESTQLTPQVVRAEDLVVGQSWVNPDGQRIIITEITDSAVIYDMRCTGSSIRSAHPVEYLLSYLYGYRYRLESTTIPLDSNSIEVGQTWTSPGSGGSSILIQAVHRHENINSRVNYRITEIDPISSQIRSIQHSSLLSDFSEMLTTGDYHLRFPSPDNTGGTTSAPLVYGTPSSAIPSHSNSLWNTIQYSGETPRYVGDMLGRAADSDSDNSDASSAAEAISKFAVTDPTNVDSLLSQIRCGFEFEFHSYGGNTELDKISEDLRDRKPLRICEMGSDSSVRGGELRTLGPRTADAFLSACREIGELEFETGVDCSFHIHLSLPGVQHVYGRRFQSEMYAYLLQRRNWRGRMPDSVRRRTRHANGGLRWANFLVSNSSKYVAIYKHQLNTWEFRLFGNVSTYEDMQTCLHLAVEALQHAYRVKLGLEHSLLHRKGIVEIERIFQQMVSDRKFHRFERYVSGELPVMATSSLESGMLTARVASGIRRAANDTVEFVYGDGPTAVQLGSSSTAIASTPINSLPNYGHSVGDLIESVNLYDIDPIAWDMYYATNRATDERIRVSDRGNGQFMINEILTTTPINSVVDSEATRLRRAGEARTILPVIGSLWERDSLYLSGERLMAGGGTVYRGALVGVPGNEIRYFRQLDSNMYQLVEDPVIESTPNYGHSVGDRISRRDVFVSSTLGDDYIATDRITHETVRLRPMPGDSTDYIIVAIRPTLQQDIGA